MWAASNDCKEVVQELLRAGANSDKKDKVRGATSHL